MERLGKLGRLVVVLLVVGGVVYGGIALASPGSSPPTLPGKGCGDKNHVHYRVGECHHPH